MFGSVQHSLPASLHSEPAISMYFEKLFEVVNIIGFSQKTLACSELNKFLSIIIVQRNAIALENEAKSQQLNVSLFLLQSIVSVILSRKFLTNNQLQHVFEFCLDPIAIHKIAEDLPTDDRFLLWYILTSWVPLKRLVRNESTSNYQYHISEFLICYFVAVMNINKIRADSPWKRSVEIFHRALVSSIANGIEKQRYSVVSHCVQLLFKLFVEKRNNVTPLISFSEIRQILGSVYHLFLEFKKDLTSRFYISSTSLENKRDFTQIARARALVEAWVGVFDGAVSSNFVIYQLPLIDDERESGEIINFNNHVARTDTVYPRDLTDYTQKISTASPRSLLSQSMTVVFPFKYKHCQHGSFVAYRHHLVGLQNFNNTCYLNGFLQVLFLTDAFCSGIFNESNFDFSSPTGAPEYEVEAKRNGQSLVNGLMLTFARLLITQHSHIEISTLLKKHLPDSYRFEKLFFLLTFSVLVSNRMLRSPLGGSWTP
jgi:hypothetical protein